MLGLRTIHENMEHSGNFVTVLNILINKETLTLLCSVAKQAGSGFTTSFRVSPHFLSSDIRKSGSGISRWKKFCLILLPIKISLVVSK